MSEIKAGDLVMVLRHCSTSRYDGTIHTVDYTATGNIPFCPCGANHAGIPAAVLNDVYHTFALSWLKKIDPPPIPASTEREKELVLL